MTPDRAGRGRARRDGPGPLPPASGGRRKFPAALAGAAAGLVNGLFGGGGGMAFLPALEKWGDVPERARYPTCVAVMFPVCAVSAGVYLLGGGVSVPQALPYLAGGLAGGALGGRLYGRVPPAGIRRLFAGFLLYAGARYLLG